jgi:hypothetical protein
MAGKTPQVLVTPTPDLGKVLNCMTEIDVEGDSNFTAAVQIAQLALKHRQNKNQRQRIVIFVASPIKEDKVGRPTPCKERCAQFLSQFLPWWAQVRWHPFILLCVNSCVCCTVGSTGEDSKEAEEEQCGSGRRLLWL